MARQFTIQDMALWAAVVAIWTSIVSLRWVLRFGAPAPGSPVTQLWPRMAAAAVFLGMLCFFTPLLYFPLRRTRNPWALSALLSGIIMYVVLFLPDWALDLLPK